MQFAGKVVLITGAGSGIGAATAIQFFKLGATLALFDKCEEKLKKIADLCTIKTGCKQTKPCIMIDNIKEECAVINMVDRTLYTFNRLDVLINNAGITTAGSIKNTSLNQFDHIMTNNLRSMYNMIILAVPHLLKTRGTIVNVSDVSGLRSFPDYLAYNISKSGVDQLTRCVALELAAKGIRCNSVNPGLIFTDLYRAAGMSEDKWDYLVFRSLYMTALGRAGNPEEVANAITFLASKEASFITGVNLPVDGGKSSMCPAEG